MLDDCKFSLSIRTRYLKKLFAAGEILECETGEVLYRQGQVASHLYVVVEGGVSLVGAGEDGDMWVGPGDVVGEVEFVLGKRYLHTACAARTGCLVWRIHRRKVLYPISANAFKAATGLFVALGAHLRARLLLATSGRRDLSDLLHNHCNHRHPSIQRMAAMLRGADAWETALATWRFVQTMPYRFGLWDMKASDVLHQGYGMCTTKANLQVALLRANGIQSAFAEMKVPSRFVVTLLPRAYRPMVGEYIKHYFATVYLDGRWFPCDASFTLESLRVMADEIPSVEICLTQSFQRGKPFNIVGEGIGRDPFEFRVLADLSGVIPKRPFYDRHNLDAMNVVLDRAQGTRPVLPTWAEQVKKLARQSVGLAFHKAYAGLFSDAYRLYRRMLAQKSGRFDETRKSNMVEKQ